MDRPSPVPPIGRGGPPHPIKALEDALLVASGMPMPVSADLDARLPGLLVPA